MNVTDRLVPASSQVVIPECPLIDNAEGLAAFWADVDVACVAEGCCCDVQEVLLKDPLLEGGGNGFVEDAHCCGGG